MRVSWVLHEKKIELLRAHPDTGSNKKRRVRLGFHTVDGLKEMMTKVILYIERDIYVYMCIYVCIYMYT